MSSPCTGKKNPIKNDGSTLSRYLYGTLLSILPTILYNERKNIHSLEENANNSFPLATNRLSNNRKTKPIRSDAESLNLPELLILKYFKNNACVWITGTCQSIEKPLQILDETQLGFEMGVLQRFFIT